MTGKLILSALLWLLLTTCYGQKTFKQHFEVFDSIQQQEKVYIQTDRTLYQPGNSIWLNAFVTNDENCPSSQSREVYVELLNPKGAVIQSKTLRNVGGCGEGQFKLGTYAVGGIYQIRAFSYWMQNFGEEHYFKKNITIQNVVLPNVLLSLNFEKEAYGSGSQVIASLKARTKENKVLANKKLNFEVQLAGQALCTEVVHTDANGDAYLVFTLPNSLKTTDALLNVKLEQDGLVESISRSVPIILNDLDLQFLPEGGHLVNNQLNRVAFKVLNEFGKPADIKAQLLGRGNQVIKTFESYHQGMGAFEFTPKDGENYVVKILEPQGINTNWSLPLGSSEKVGLYLKEQKKDRLLLDIYSNKKQSLKIVAQQQGKLCYEEEIAAEKGINTQSIVTKKMPMGIVQITVFDAQQQPQCERLVFVNKDRRLDISISTDKEKYLPREEVKLTIQATDETGKGVLGNFGLAVTDDKQHTFIDDKQDNILSYLLMSSDLKGVIEEPSFYFDPTEEKAEKALDYVMLTHGWRRYDWNKLLGVNLETLADSIAFEANSDEISGYLKINGNLYPEKRISLSEKRFVHHKKKSLLSTMTNKNGFFKFKRAGLKFPVYINLKHEGKRHTVKIQNYSKAGLKLIRKEDVGDLVDLDKEVGKLNGAIRSTTTNGAKAELSGKIIDIGNDEGLPFANVVLEKDGAQVSGIQTDFDGNYIFNSIEEGTYDLVVSYVGFPSVKTEGIGLRNGSHTILDIEMEEGNFNTDRIIPSEEFILIDVRKLTERNKKIIDPERASDANNPKREVGAVITSGATINSPDGGEIIVRDYRIPLIEQDATAGGQTLGAEDIKNLATRNITSIVATTAGVSQADEGEAINSNGSRISSNDTYVDGVRVVGNFGIPVTEIDEVQIITSGVPAEFENARTDKYAQCVVRSYRIPLIDQSNTSGGQTLLSSDIVSRGGYGGYSNSNYRKTYDKVNFKQVGTGTYSPVVRFYAPKYKARKVVKKRTDFRKTIYWNPKVTTNAEGLATITYCNSDEITTFRARVEGRSENGKLGLGEHTYSVQLPFSLNVKLPTVLSYWDTLTMPIVLKNTTATALNGKLMINTPRALRLLDSIPAKVNIPANDVLVLYVSYLVKEKRGTHFIGVTFEGQGFRDVIQQKIKVISKGYRTTFSMAGDDFVKQDSFILHPHYKGSLDAELQIYPALLDGFMDGVEGILRQPSGCFEQVSSSNYPNILALQVMKETGYLNPEIREKALDYLEIGYQKLLGYEIKGGGFEWYGQGAAHEGLTAYGLAQFKDLEEVYDGTNPNVIERTKQFLLSRRNGNGGFKQNAGRYGFSGNRPAVFNAYITWALSKVGTKGIDREINFITKEAMESKDLYRLSLACLTLFNVGQKEKGQIVLNEIISQIKTVGVENVSAETTLTYSRGRSNRIETLAWAGLAMLSVEKVDEGLLAMLVKCILSDRKYGRFGSSQATTMALKLLSQYQKTQSKVEKDGRFELYINGELVASDVYTKTVTKKIQVTNLQQYLAVGKNKIEVKFEGTHLPYVFDTQWSATEQAAKQGCPLELKTNLQTEHSTLGETVRMNIQLTNSSSTTQPSPMAIVGIPAGLSLQPWQLKELQEKGSFAYYELKDQQLVLYFRELAANEKKQLALDLKADIPGVYTAQSSNAYLYYADEQKYWTKGTKIAIAE